MMSRTPIFVLLITFCITARAAELSVPNYGKPLHPSTAARPTEPIAPENCVTAECHPSVKQYKALHAPVLMNSCDTCHESTDAKAHQFRMKHEGKETCTYCHEFDVEGVPVVHEPVAKGECIGCHDPHGGFDNRFVRENSLKEMCARCHEDVTDGAKHLHKPVADGTCESCHTSHASRFPKLLYNEGEALCMSCHDQFRNQLVKARFRHDALKEGCSTCHTSHASNLPAQLRKNVTDLCSDCHDRSPKHDKVRTEIAQAKYKHSTATTGEKACVTCHTAHGSDLAFLMNDLPVNVCGNCHAEKVKTDRGYVVAAMPELKDPKTIKHGPINDGQCGACHDVHGSQQPLLLAKANNAGFYQTMVAENYQLCFDCHDFRLGTEEQTSSATAFRNGDENLHFLHANDGERGHNCKFCHATHASHSDRHVNDFIQYGQWKMPIEFKRTETGGSCSPGCHKPFAYDRNKPVSYASTTRPTTQPTTRQAKRMQWLAAASTKPYSAPPRPAPIDWILTTATGARVKVPNSARPTVLIFTRAKQSQREALHRLVASVLPDTSRAHVVLLVGGEGASAEAKRLSSSMEAPWPVVADEPGSYFDRLQVHTWPTILIVKPDGAQAARLAGAPESLPHTLGAYLDYASGKIDRQALATRLSTRKSTVGETPAHQEARALATVRQLLLAGNVDQARSVLASACAEHPESVPLKVEQIKLWTRLGSREAAEALDLINKIPPEAIPQDQRQLLVARAYVRLGRWTQARALATAVLKLDPKSPEAHYILGRTYEATGDWSKAAQSYRAAHEQPDP